MEQWWHRLRQLPRWVQVTLGVLAVGIVVGLAGGSGEDDAADERDPAQAPTTVQRPKPKPKPPTEQELARRAWRSFIDPRARTEAAALGARVVKLQPSVSEPKDYGTGAKQAVGTAYVEVKSSSGFKGGLIYSAELTKLGSRWRVDEDSLEERKP